MAWHGDPGLLRRDGFSGDYGPGVYGYWRSAAAYVTCMPPFGWSCFLCDLVVSGSEAPSSSSSSSKTSCDAGVTLEITPRDAFGRRVYLAPLGLTITVEGGRLAEVKFEPSERLIELSIAAHERAGSRAASLFLEVERRDGLAPAPASAYTCTECEQARKAGAFVVPLAADGGGPTRVSLVAKLK